MSVKFLTSPLAAPPGLLRRSVWALRRCFICTLLSFTFYGPAWADQQEEMQKLQENIQQLQKELKSIQGERSELQKNLQHSESEIGELLKKIEKLNREMKDQDKQLRELYQQRDELKDARQLQQTEVAEQIAAAYQLGQQSQIKLLLNQESPERVTRLLKYHQYFLAARSEKLTAYNATLEQLDAIEPKIAEKKIVLANSQAKLKNDYERVKQHQKDRQAALAKINSTLKNKDQELRQFQEDRERLQTLLRRVAHTTASVPVAIPTGNESFSSRKGKLPWPTQGKVIHQYGSQRIAGQMQWNGLMIKAAEGNNVIAVHHGRVVFADYFRGHGLLLIIDHGQGFLSLYAHNQSLYKTTGDWVKAGDAIASVGNSGGQTDTALYFEIRQNGKPTDPAQWLARA